MKRISWDVVLVAGLLGCRSNPAAAPHPAVSRFELAAPVPVRESLSARLPASADGAVRIEFGQTPGAWIEESLEGARGDSKPQVMGGRQLYAAAKPGLDRIFEIDERHVEEYLHIEDAQAAKQIEYRVRTGPAVASLTVDGSGVGLVASDASGRALAKSPGPLGLDARGNPVRGRLVPRRVGPNAFSIRVVLDGSPLVPILLDPSWIAAASLGTARTRHTATLLSSGKVLVAGGSGQSTAPYLSTAEIYDPASGTWDITGFMTDARTNHTATLLSNGMVLVVGGDDNGNSLAGAELYDPTAGSFAITGSLKTARESHTATLLRDGRVLVTGGNSNGMPLASAEIYDPATASWTSSGNLASARASHTATLLANGKVLVVGGEASGAVVGSSEIFDPTASNWTTTNASSRAFFGHTATLLADGRVLVAGGYDAQASSGAALYDPNTGSWSPTGSMSYGRAFHTATLLPDGQVLLADGEYGATSATGQFDLYDPAQGAFTVRGGPGPNRYHGTATLLPGGHLLVAGGDDGVRPLQDCAAYDSSAGFWGSAGTLSNAVESHSATILPSGQVLVAGGASAGTYVAAVQLYDLTTGRWSNTGSLSVARATHAAVLLPNGKVLVAGGFGSAGALASAELYDPAAGKWTTTGSMGTARGGVVATLLPNGNVLIAGGDAGGGTALASAEVYDPTTGTWTNAGTLRWPRAAATFTLLPTGRLLVVGGDYPGGGVVGLSTAELFDPVTGLSTPTGSLTDGRYSHTASLLPDGRVWVVGGINRLGFVWSAEVFDPVSGSWTSAGSTQARARHAATVLLDGRVLISGGDTAFGPTNDGELYDPASGNQTPSTLSWNRRSHTATLLPNGEVIAIGGNDGMNDLATVEIFDEGLGYPESIRPVLEVSPATAPAGSTVVLAGIHLQGYGEGSGGQTSSSSSTNYPLAFLQRDDTGQLLSAWTSDSPWSQSSSTLQAHLPSAILAGCYRLFVVTNGIPSWSVPIVIGAAPPGCSIGGNTITSGALDPNDPCQSCQPAVSQNSYTALADGTTCDDGNACTLADACRGGTCMGTTPVACSPIDQCHVAGTCDPRSGACSNPPVADGTACAGGSCRGGVCVMSPGGGTDAGQTPVDAGSRGSESDAGSGSAGGDAGSALVPGADAADAGQPLARAQGCGCGASGFPPVVALFWMGVAVVLRRSARRRPFQRPANAARP